MFTILQECQYIIWLILIVFSEIFQKGDLRKNLLEWVSKLYFSRSPLSWWLRVLIFTSQQRRIWIPIWTRWLLLRILICLRPKQPIHLPSSKNTLRNSFKYSLFCGVTIANYEVWRVKLFFLFWLNFRYCSFTI